MKKSKKAGLILTVGAALFLVAGAPALADETDTISKNVYIGGVNVSGMTEEQATKAVEEKPLPGSAFSGIFYKGEKHRPAGNLSVCQSVYGDSSAQEL